MLVPRLRRRHACTQRARLPGLPHSCCMGRVGSLSLAASLAQKGMPASTRPGRPLAQSPAKEAPEPCPSGWCCMKLCTRSRQPSAIRHDQSARVPAPNCQKVPITAPSSQLWSPCDLGRPILLQLPSKPFLTPILNPTTSAVCHARAAVHSVFSHRARESLCARSSHHPLHLLAPPPHPSTTHQPFGRISRAAPQAFSTAPSILPLYLLSLTTSLLRSLRRVGSSVVCY